ncbi:MAG: short-chain dehydrogenase [Candidatus Omnitrophica bacterium CG11_big_fil_rev_8_21_14_0_20_45_26]|uniref:Short-chain dehydrogenase n=1 Tax=Candidatus Abzuiibacterium crystallinum TaxID=1974748 RepID=A0A2H0LKU1_9BACT|nr:MAG: short-chain dehydrogenase [Candidatus Omnitrophica bacterium CG11_big_fil_rev_8_21_14_0_20_45_26]PIW63892.1 MAG: short-chain dehydrogenase [Candidatus Omnitrophica bacterium CG12_big_fil_rev_8_21_14_0_65_45_16]
MKIKGKIALVTGGAKRIGNEIALGLASKGAHVVITYLHSKKEAQVTVKKLKRYGVKAHAIQADQSRAHDVNRVFREVMARFKRLDILVNSAANYLKTPFTELTENDFNRSVDTNLKGPYLYAITFGKEMLKRRSGKIIHIGDWGIFRPYNDYLPYFVSKGGVATLTKALAKALAPFVQVNAILPGPMMLPEGTSARERQAIIRETPLKRIGSPRDIAAAVEFLIEGSDFITGALLPVDGGRSIQ